MPWREGLVPFRWPTTLSYKLPVVAWIVVERWITIVPTANLFFLFTTKKFDQFALKTVFCWSVWNLSIKAFLQNLQTPSRSIQWSSLTSPGLVPKRWRTGPACINTSSQLAMAMEGTGQQHGADLHRLEVHKQKGSWIIMILLMDEILHQLIGSLSHYLQGFIHPRWSRISSINSMMFRYVVWYWCYDGVWNFKLY